MKAAKIILCLLILIFLFSCSRKTIIRKSYPQKFEGLTQLILASETTNISFSDTLTKKFLFFKLSDAVVRVDANVTFDFYLDFKNDGYQIEIDSTRDEMQFFAPPIRVKKPQYNSREVSFPDKGIFVDEEKEALKILDQLADKIIEQEGFALLQEEYVVEQCTKQLTAFLFDLCNKLNYNISSIRIIYYKKQEIAENDNPE